MPYNSPVVSSNNSPTTTANAKEGVRNKIFEMSPPHFPVLVPAEQQVMANVPSTKKFDDDDDDVFFDPALVGNNIVTSASSAGDIILNPMASSYNACTKQNGINTRRTQSEPPADTSMPDLSDDDSFSTASESTETSFDDPYNATILNPLAPAFNPRFLIDAPGQPCASYNDYQNNLYAAQRTYRSVDVVFVGNLPAQFDDLTLTEMIMKKFAAFGQCYALVRRNPNQPTRPWAIVQYCDAASSNAALSHGGSIQLGFRNCRVSASRACPPIFVGGDSALLAALQGYGQLRSVGGGWWCFEHFGAFADARRGLGL